MATTGMAHIAIQQYLDGKVLKPPDHAKKRTGWGAQYPPEKHNGEWEYQAFNADKSVNHNENLDRCFSRSKAPQDFVWTFDQMKSAK
jgi:hypothetical protein